MVFVSVLLFAFWKVFKGTTLKKPVDVDLVWETPAVAAYEAATEDEVLTFWREMVQMFRFRR